MLGIGNKKYRDILVKLRLNGSTHTIRAHEIAQTIEGQSFEYVFDGKLMKIGIPRNYPLYYDKATGLRVVGQHYGANLAVDLFGEFIPDDADVATTILTTSALIKTTKAVHGEKGFPWTWLIIGAVVVVVLFFGYQMIKGNNPSGGGGVQVETVQSK